LQGFCSLQFPIFAVMRHPDRVYFDALKSQIVTCFRNRYPDCPDDISQWKGRVIENFQEDLQEKVKGRISTRWFYDHLKSDKEDRIPRVDILNLLSEYCGFDSWEAFKEQKKSEGLKERPVKLKLGNKRFVQRLSFFIAMISVAIVFFKMNSETISETTDNIEYKISFVDSDFGMPIANKNVEIILLESGSEGVVLKADSNGCIKLELKNETVRFAVNADYYKTDTIEINTGDKKGETIQLKIDDYSMLIHQLSVTKSEEWERRRNQLDKMISENAVIFLVTENNQGIEMYNKGEFIDRMTMPISALKNLRILQTQYKDGKISKMRITQEDTQ
jgi:cell division protein FtsL